jgi:hypothetical protein
MPEIPWHLQSTGAPVGKFNPRSREDQVSRKIWNENVVEGDKRAERVHYIKKMTEKYPEYCMNEILRKLPARFETQK